MNLLIVAHPDDEIIWFNPKEFDQIIIVFGARVDKPWMGEARRKALLAHPYKKKISFLDLPESGYWRNKDMVNMHRKNYVILEKHLNDFCNNCNYKKVYTHNSKGEYGHLDHILIHDVVKRVFYYKRSIPLWAITEDRDILELSYKDIKTDLDDFYQIKEIYVKYQVWTWKLSYIPEDYRRYRQVF